MSDSAKEAARKAWAEQMLERADSEGSVELSGGYWLHSQEDIIAEQEGWPEENEAKDMDFTTDPYWITATGSDLLEAVDGAEDLPAECWIGNENTMESLLDIDGTTTAQEIRAAVAAGLDPNEREPQFVDDDHEERTPFRAPLHFAQNAEQTKALLEAGADPNACSHNGRYPLHDAHGTEQTKALLTAGADPNVSDYDGQTPLHMAHDAEQTKALLEAGADPNARNKSGFVPLHGAQDAGQAKVLLDANAKVPEGLDEKRRGFVEQALASQATKGESFVLSDRAREAVRPEPAKSADYETLNAVWGRDMSPDAMNERACAWADQDKPYRDAMEPAALDQRAKAQDEWEREHTHSNPFGGKSIKAKTDEKSPMDELRDLRQEHEDGLKVLREDADFLNAAVKGHREYSLVYATLADRGGVLDATKLAERTEASREHDPAVQDMLAKTEPVRERSDESGRSDDGSGGSGPGGMGKPALKKSLAAATGR